MPAGLLPADRSSAAGCETAGRKRRRATPSGWPGRLWAAALAAVLALFGDVGRAVAAAGAASGRGTGSDESPSITRLMDPDGGELLATGIRLGPGDRFLAPDNRLYEVTEVSGSLARTRLVGRRRLGGASDLAAAWAPAPWEAGGWWAAAPAGPGGAGRPPWQPAVSWPWSPSRLLAIYHTHSDESYLPDSGVTNRPWNGDIFQVGRVMSLTWRTGGIPTFHSYNRHDPHDGLAYTRSRRTALSLVRKNPVAVFDVHRDTPPASVYRRFVDGQPLASVLLVVGRQNPTMAANEAFAFAIKGYADRTYPQLIRGVLYAAGDYNQDLHPRAMLAEVGSTYNRLQEAELGARLFSAVVPAILFGMRLDPERMPPEPPPEQAYRERASRGGWRAAFILLVLAVAGGSLWVLINEQAYETVFALWERLRQRRPIP